MGLMSQAFSEILDPMYIFTKVCSMFIFLDIAESLTNKINMWSFPRMVGWEFIISVSQMWHQCADLPYIISSVASSASEFFFFFVRSLGIFFCHHTTIKISTPQSMSYHLLTFCKLFSFSLCSFNLNFGSWGVLIYIFYFYII